MEIILNLENFTTDPKESQRAVPGWFLHILWEENLSSLITTKFNKVDFDTCPTQSLFYNDLPRLNLPAQQYRFCEVFFRALCGSASGHPWSLAATPIITLVIRRIHHSASNAPHTSSLWSACRMRTSLTFHKEEASVTEVNISLGDCWWMEKTTLCVKKTTSTVVIDRSEYRSLQVHILRVVLETVPLARIHGTSYLRLCRAWCQNCLTFEICSQNG